ncbi:MAG: sigma-70 family RNA polymerase sigma factor [Pirellulales bacterium]
MAANDLAARCLARGSFTTDSRIELLAGGDQPTPAEQAATNEASLLLAQALEALPADDQQLIRLRHFEQLSHDEIAVRLGCSPATVRMRWVRVLRKLREQFAGGSENRSSN